MNNDTQPEQNPMPTPEPAFTPEPVPTPAPEQTPASAPLPTQEPMSTPLPVNDPLQADNPFIAGLPPEPKAPKRSRKKAVIITSIIVVLLLAIGAVAFFLSLPKTSNNVTANKNTTQTALKPAPLTAQGLVDEVRIAQEKLAKTYPESKLDRSETPSSPAYKYSGAAYYISGSFGSDVLVSDTSANGNTTATEPSPVIKAAHEAAFKALDAHKSLAKTSTETLTTYQDDDVICTVSTDAIFTTSTNCADKKDYASLAKQIKPFADAYASVPKDDQISNLVFSSPKITEKSGGFSNATVSIGPFEGMGGFAGLFYAKDGNWTFWRGTQSQIDCTDYNTYELQKAFEGTSCYDATTQNENATVAVTLSAS